MKDITYLASFEDFDSVVCLFDVSRYPNLNDYKNTSELLDTISALTTILIEEEDSNYSKQRMSSSAGGIEFEVLEIQSNIEGTYFDKYWIAFRCEGKKYIISMLLADNQNAQRMKELLLNSIECKASG